jgi:hypothetical protein
MMKVRSRVGGGVIIDAYSKVQMMTNTKNSECSEIKMQRKLEVWMHRRLGQGSTVPMAELVIAVGNEHLGRVQGAEEKSGKYVKEDGMYRREW